MLVRECVAPRLSPCMVGMIETRTSTRRPNAFTLSFPSCGTRCSADIQPSHHLQARDDARTDLACKHRPGSAETPSIRCLITIPARLERTVNIARTLPNGIVERGV